MLEVEVVKLMMLLVVVVVVILFNFGQIRKIGSRFGAGDDFLGVDLVELIGKRSSFGLETNSNRKSAVSGFDITTGHRH